MEVYTDQLTFEFLAEIIEKYRIPKNVHLVSDSGWECNESEMDRAYYNKITNTIVFSQNDGFGGCSSCCCDYSQDENWIMLY